MKTKILLAFTLLSFQSLAADKFNIVSELSSVSFATIKKQFVVEPATINGLTGNLDDTGKFEINVPVVNIDTGVSIRNERLKSLFFNSALNPTIAISGQFKLATLKNDVEKAIVPASVSFYGKTKAFNFPVMITKAKNAITISSYAPVIVKASDFGIPTENLNKLSATVGGLALSDIIPLSINIVLKK